MRETLPENRVAAYDWQERLRQRINPNNLPVGKAEREIAEFLEAGFSRGGKAALIQGETGSGKSILLPGFLERILKKQGKNNPRTLVVQPRRDAAMNVSRAISAIQGKTWGESGQVGCSTSEVKEISGSADTAVVTSGIALRYVSNILKDLMEGKSFSMPFDAIMVDEVHENSVEYHLILGILKMIQTFGVDIKILLTSATLDKEKIQDFFSIDDRQYRKVEGKTFPVEKKFLSKEETDRFNGDYIKLAAEEAKKALREDPPGDILIFMPGVREISATIEALGEIEGIEIVPLHGSLSIEERDYAINGGNGKRRIVVATNVAETSLTLPRITSVIDSCRRRTYEYNSQSGIEEKKTSIISKDSADQRAGRAGRVQEGVCRRLITEEDWNRMDDFTIPEIMYKNLSNVVLKLRGLGISSLEFPFLDQPEMADLEAAENQLKMLGALDEQGVVTPIGERMLEMPFFDPSIARMIVEAEKRDCLEAVLPLAIMGRESNIFFSPSKGEVDNEFRRLARNAYGMEFSGSVLMRDGYKVDKAVMDEIKRQALINKREEYESIHGRFGRSSDWERDMEVFLEAIKRGVFEASRSYRTPGGYLAGNEFFSWCRENHLNPNALKHVAHHISDYARALRIDIDRKKLEKSLEEADWGRITLAILAGHPSHMFFSQGAGMAIEYWSFANNQGKVSINPGSACFKSGPKYFVASRMQDGKGMKSGREIKRTYAHKIHPVSLKQMRELHPDFFEEKPGDISIGEDGNIKVNYYFFPKSFPGSRLEKSGESSNESEVRESVARDMADRYGGKLVGHINILGINDMLIDRMRMGAFSWQSSINNEKVADLYLEKLKAIPGPISLENLKEHEGMLRLSERELSTGNVEEVINISKDDLERRLRGVLEFPPGRRNIEPMKPIEPVIPPVSRRVDLGGLGGSMIYDYYPEENETNTAMERAFQRAGVELPSEPEVYPVSGKQDFIPRIIDRKWKKPVEGRHDSDITISEGSSLLPEHWGRIRAERNPEKKWEIIFEIKESLEREHKIIEREILRLEKEINKEKDLLEERDSLTEKIGNLSIDTGKSKGKSNDRSQRRKSLIARRTRIITLLAEMKGKKQRLEELKSRKDALERQVKELSRLEEEILGNI